MRPIRTLAPLFLLAAFAAAAPRQEKDLVAAAAGDGRFSTLVSLLQKANLTNELEKPGPFTLFAPTNDAFMKVPPATMAKLSADPALLKKVLLYHVASGKLASTEFKKGPLASLQGEALAIKVPKKVKEGAKKPKGPEVSGAKLLQRDLPASNGLIQVVDRVLAPPSLGLDMGVVAKKKKDKGAKKGLPSGGTIPPPVAPGGAGPGKPGGN